MSVLNSCDHGEPQCTPRSTSSVKILLLLLAVRTDSAHVEASGRCINDRQRASQAKTNTTTSIAQRSAVDDCLPSRMGPHSTGGTTAAPRQRTDFHSSFMDLEVRHVLHFERESTFNLEHDYVGAVEIHVQLLRKLNNS